MLMYRKLAALLLLSVFSLGFSTAALAEASPTFSQVLQTSVPNAAGNLQACPDTLGKKLNLAETSQTDCCKGHKGVCGCRAGKIVCCDGTASPNCTCHGDDGLIQ